MIYKPHCHYQNFSPLANRVYLIAIIKEALLEAQRELLYYENQIRACLKVQHQLVYMGKKVCLLCRFLDFVTVFNLVY